MKETTRNKIVRYAISAAFVSTILIVGLLISIGLDWLSDKTGWPILSSFGIICFVYLVWRVGKGITVSDEEKQVVKLEPSKDLDKEFDKCCENYIFDDECEVYTARKFFELGFKAKGE
jgi:hypothetical protein